MEERPLERSINLVDGITEIVTVVGLLPVVSSVMESGEIPIIVPMMWLARLAEKLATVRMTMNERVSSALVLTRISLRGNSFDTRFCLLMSISSRFVKS